jgi:hypothetical protein
VSRGGGGAPVVRGRGGKRGGGRGRGAKRSGGPGGYKGTGRNKDGTPCVKGGRQNAQEHEHQHEQEDDDEDDGGVKEVVPVESDEEEVRETTLTKPRNVRTPSNAEPVTTRKGVGAGSKRDIDDDDDIAHTTHAKRLRLSGLGASASAPPIEAPQSTPEPIIDHTMTGLDASASSPNIEASHAKPEIIIDRKMRDHFTCTFCNMVRKLSIFLLAFSACAFCLRFLLAFSACACYTAGGVSALRNAFVLGVLATVSCQPCTAEYLITRFLLWY